MISRLDLVALVVFAGVLFVSKPSEAEVEAEIKTAIVADINAAQIDREGEFLSNLLTVTCKFDAESCYKIARAAMHVSYKDFLLLASIKIATGNRQRNCVGAFKNLFCPSFLN